MLKQSFSSILTVLICAALLCAALCIGSVRGWNMERDAALSALGEGGDLRRELEYRGMDAANLAVVASRHLSASDADLTALRSASETLLNGHTAADVLLAADETLTEAALRLGESLSALPSVQESSRDSNYVASLTNALSRRSSIVQRYDSLVKDFNARLSGSPTGKLAMLLGVKPIALPQE